MFFLFGIKGMIKISQEIPSCVSFVGDNIQGEVIWFSHKQTGGRPYLELHLQLKVSPKPTNKLQSLRQDIREEIPDVSNIDMRIKSFMASYGVSEDIDPDLILAFQRTFGIRRTFTY